jgi:hypothetical protein
MAAVLGWQEQDWAVRGSNDLSWLVHADESGGQAGAAPNAGLAGSFGAPAANVMPQAAPAPAPVPVAPPAPAAAPVAAPAAPAAPVAAPSPPVVRSSEEIAEISAAWSAAGTRPTWRGPPG